MSNKNKSPSIITVSSWSRPNRVAFFFNPASTKHEHLNEIFRYCINLWGGRYHVIIPTDGNEIHENWWNLLRMADPDVILSLLPLSDSFAEKINRYVAPYKINELDNGELEREHCRFIAPHDINALSVEDIPKYLWANKSPFKEPAFFLFPEKTENDDFLLLNFGTVPNIASTTRTFAGIPVSSIDPILNIPAIFDRLLAHHGDSIFPIDFSERLVRRSYSLDYSPEAEGFHLVIGDSLLDRVYAWNLASIQNPSWSRNLLWLSSEMARDDSILQMVNKWITYKHYSGSSPHRGKIVSYSVSKDSLDAVAKKIHADIIWEVKPSGPTDYPAFKWREFKPAHEKHTQQITLSEDAGLVSFPRPDFLAPSVPEGILPRQESWMVDLEIQYRPEKFGYTNSRPNWILPKRINLSHLFFDSRNGRIVNYGLPSCGVGVHERCVKVKIPKDRDVIVSFFDEFATYYGNRGKRHSIKRHRFTEIVPSKDGRSLRGLLSIFGNLFYANHYLADDYWSLVFLKMAGRNFDKEKETRVKRSLRVLDDIFEKKSEPLTKGDTRLHSVAEALADELTLRDPEPKEISIIDLKSIFGEWKGQAAKGSHEKGEDWEIFKADELQGLADSGIFIQGAMLPCNHCGSRLWYPLEDIRSKIKCYGCFYEFPPTTQPLEWSFRLNSLVCNALRKEGALALIRALYHVEQFSRDMFLFLPCQDVYEKESKEPFAELDIVCLHDGKFTIGEVKSSWAGFEKKDMQKLKKLEELALEILPHQVILAAQDGVVSETLKNGILKLREKLKLNDIRLTVISFGPDEAVMSILAGDRE